MAIEVALAVDIGGTKVDAALVDGAGGIVPGSRHREATGAGQTSATFSTVLASVCGRAADAAAPGSHRIVGVGIGAAGPLLRGGTSISPLNMPGIRDFALAPAVASAAPGAPVRVALDGTCITLAEHRFGALRGVRNGIAMVVSTGIGGGIVLDGRIVLGNAGNAGHVGQVWVRRPDPADPVRATVEAVAAGPATVRWANERGWPGADGRALAVDYAAGHPLAVEAVRRSASAVGHAIAAYAALLDLEVVAIGGGFARVARDYVELVEAAAHELAVLPAARGIRVVRAALGDDAPLVGAAMLVLGGVGEAGSVETGVPEHGAGQDGVPEHGTAEEGSRAPAGER
jgi:glucokinase